jgi:AcrR family transcriptional regulator
LEQPEAGRLEKRRQAFVEAARAVFIEKGFERTALSDVVERSGGSLTTLYKLFGNKAGLLTAVVQERVRTGETLIEEIGASGLEPGTALHVLGEELERRMLEPESVAVSRIVIAYSLQDAQFASNFYRQTLHQSEQALSRLFGEWRCRGVALQGEPDTLAAIFLGMFVYDLHSEAISGGALVRPDGEQMKNKVAFFCRGAGLAAEAQDQGRTP